MNKNLLAVLIFGVWVVLGVVFLLMGFNMNAEYNELKRICTEEMQAVVTDFYITGEVYWDSDEDIPTKRDNRVYYPIFEYTVNNETYRQQSPVGKGVNQVKVKVGEGIPIMYNPAKPDDYYVPAGTYATKNGTAVMGFGIFMIAFLGFALIMIFIKNRK